MNDDTDVRKYSDYFHDGTIFNISKNEKEITFKMISAEVDDPEMENGITLSKDHRIRGILHLCNVKEINLTGDYKIENLFDIFNLGTILDFEIMDNTVEFGILWENCPPKPHTNEFTTIIIQADRIWWENIPDLDVLFS